MASSSTNVGLLCLLAFGAISALYAAIAPGHETIRASAPLDSTRHASAPLDSNLIVPASKEGLATSLLAGTAVQLAGTPSAEERDECTRWERESSTFVSLRASRSKPGEVSVDWTNSIDSPGAADADLWLFGMLFRHLKRPGVFVELAAAWPRRLSMSYFLDVCQGWRGLCIEPTARDTLAEAWLSSNRGCVLVPRCISSEPSVSFVDVHATDTGGGGTSNVVPASKTSSTRGGTIRTLLCSTLDQVLRENARQRVDFMTIDVEDYEFEAIQTIVFENVEIDVILMEEHSTGKTKMAMELLKSNGYLRVDGGFNGDGLYIRRGSIYETSCSWGVQANSRGWNNPDGVPEATCDFSHVI